MFGPIMQFRVSDLPVKLAPIRKEEMSEFVRDGGMQSRKVTKYLHRGAMVLEDEYEWYEKTRNSRDVVVWGIYALLDSEWLLIGNSALGALTYDPYRSAVSGSMIFRPEWWGKGIASHCHMARTMYAFDQLNLVVVRSAVLTGNEASFRALCRVGYVQVSTERNDAFVDGQWLHKRNLEMVNPVDGMWREWWHGENPGKTFREARTSTSAVLEWARQHVELP